MASASPISVPAPAVAPEGSAGTPFLQVQGLARSYQADRPVFADVSFTMARGEFVCIIGHSG